MSKGSLISKNNFLKKAVISMNKEFQRNESFLIGN